MAISPALLPAVLLFYLLIINGKSRASISQSSHSLIDEIREAELKVVRLESILEESISIVDSKNVYIKESEKVVEEMTSELDHLQSLLLTMKVRLLWDTARRNNFELHSLESKAQDAEEKLEIAKSRVEEMASIVNEQWSQIQHLEHAVEITQRRSKQGKMQISSTRCSFLKFVEKQFGNLVGNWAKMMERSWSAVEQNHYQLQRFVKTEMQKWKYTAAVANKEVVFFVASALITFPALSLGMFIFNNFCLPSK